jgi:thiamine-phosphate diphosphorylase
MGDSGSTLVHRPPRLFWVTDDSIVARPDFAHGLDGRQFWQLAVRLKAAAAAAGASFWVNDRIDAAVAVRADGVQLGAASLGPDAARALLGRSAMVGKSIHSAGEGAAAVAAGADLLVLGSIYATESHPARTPLGTDELREAAAGTRPIVAIGGITPDRVKEVMSAGARGVAVRSGVWQADDVAAAVRRYLGALESVK